MNNRPKKFTKKQCASFIADPAVKRREDLDFFDVSKAYEFPDGSYVLVSDYTGKGNFFENLSELQTFRSSVSNSTEGEHILEEYATGDDTIESLVTKAIDHLSTVLHLPVASFTQRKDSFKAIDKMLKPYVKQSLDRLAERNLVQSVISYLSATIAYETGATLSLKLEPSDKKYYPTLALDGHVFNVVTNVSDALLEYRNKFGLSFCYESQPMESL